MSFAEFLTFTGKQLQCPHLAYQGALEKQIQTVALCGGSGVSYLRAAQKAGADVYVTGDVKYHDAQAASELGLCVVDLRHNGFQTVFIGIFHTAWLSQKGLAAFFRQKSARASHLKGAVAVISHKACACHSPCPLRNF